MRAYPGQDGMGILAATMPLPVLRACQQVLRQHARECAVPGEERTLDQRMLDCLVDLLLRPDAAGRPPVRAQLTIVATADTLAGGGEPGEIDGHPVPAVLVREVAHAFGLLPRPAPADASTPQTAATTEATTTEATTTEATTTEATTTEAAYARPADAAPEPAGGQPTDTESAPSEPRFAGGQFSSAEPAVAGLGDLLPLRSTADTALAELPMAAIVGKISGQLLALTFPTEIRRAATCARPACRTGRTPCTHPPSGPGLGPPPDSPGYRPSAALQRFVRARDRRCRFPGCRARAERCDLDHNTLHPAGATSCDNLCCLCRHHHRRSHQAPCWTMHRLPDGGIEWTTPSGDRITTHPPRYGTDDPPPTPPDRPSPLTLRERVLGRPATPEERRTDPAPL